MGGLYEKFFLDCVASRFWFWKSHVDGYTASSEIIFMAAALYKIFVRGELIATNVRTAEMCKLAETSFRDVNILQPGAGMGGH